MAQLDKWSHVKCTQIDAVSSAASALLAAKRVQAVMEEEVAEAQRASLPTP